MYSRFDYIDAARAAAEDFVELVGAVADPEFPIAHIPGWTITDCLGHVATAPGRFLERINGAGSWPTHPADLPDFNAKQIANLSTRDRSALCRRLLTDLDDLLDTVAHLGACVPTINFAGEQRVRADAALGILIGEFLVHGFDIARAARLPWQIDPGMAALVARGRHQVLASWVDTGTCADHTATYDIRLRGCGERFVYEFTDGWLEINPESPRPADVHISVGADAAMLAGYGRLSPMRLGLSGQAFAWGGKPWLAPRLAKMFIPA